MALHPLSSKLLDSDLPDTQTLDLPKRIHYMKSTWQRLTHLREKKQLDRDIVKDMKHLFSIRYDIESTALEKVWKEITGNQWNGSSILTLGQLRKIDETIRNTLIFHGKGIRPPKLSKNVTDQTIQKIVQSIVHGAPFDPRILEKNHLRAIFIKNDPNMMKSFHEALQLELNNLATLIPKNPQEEVVWHMFHKNILSLLPFTYPKNTDKIDIPVLKDGHINLVTYQMEVLPLHLNSLINPTSALGLTPENVKEGPHYLVYRGTTFPGADDHLATVIADFTPLHSVGEAIYNNNKELLHNWIKEKRKIHEQGAIILGLSLGGALGLLHALDQTTEDDKDSIAEAHIYNPAGLYPNVWKREINQNCKVKIYVQPNDIVSMMGTWPTGPNIALYKAYAHQEGMSENMAASHVRIYSGCEKVTVIKQNPEKENRSLKRRILTILHQILGPWIVFLPISFGVLLHRFGSLVHRVSRFCICKLKKT